MGNLPEYLSRFQFGFTACYHIMFPALSIGLGWFLVIIHGLYLKTNKNVYFRIYKFWSAADRLSGLEEKPIMPHPTCFPEVRLMSLSIDFDKLDFGFGSRPILTKATVTFHQYQTHLIRGANGSGKTTLLDLISGLLTASPGSLPGTGTFPAARHEWFVWPG
jgi:ABC-type multidrug transport system fused ATPase/permease subunit